MATAVRRWIFSRLQNHPLTSLPPLPIFGQAPPSATTFEGWKARHGSSLALLQKHPSIFLISARWGQRALPFHSTFGRHWQVERLILKPPQKSFPLSSPPLRSSLSSNGFSPPKAFPSNNPADFSDHPQCIFGKVRKPIPIQTRLQGACSFQFFLALRSRKGRTFSISQAKEKELPKEGGGPAFLLGRQKRGVMRLFL